MPLPDHRRLGRELEIFATEDECGAGLPLWLPAGTAVREQLRSYVIDLDRRHGYRHVSTPSMAKRSLYERSGHWAHYHDDMYPPMELGAEQVVLRPMLCPHHILIYDAAPRSWRELPYRLAEVGPMFRYERSGVVGGLARVRQMTLTDGHAFCAPEQVGDELSTILEMVDEVYRALCIPPPRLRFSRAGTGAKYAGDPAAWERSEAMIRGALHAAGAEYVQAADEAAFYGPKIDLQVTDPQGREKTLSTIQVDCLLPGRFGLGFRRGGGEPEPPVIVHRSVASTLERMVAHLLEVHDGALPVWLAPIQVQILPVGEDRGHAEAIRGALGAAGLRTEVDDRAQTLAARVREAWRRRVPYVAVVGDREAADGSVSVRVRGGRQLGPMPVAAFVAVASDAVERKVREPL